MNRISRKQQWHKEGVRHYEFGKRYVVVDNGNTSFHLGEIVRFIGYDEKGELATFEDFGGEQQNFGGCGRLEIFKESGTTEGGKPTNPLNKRTGMYGCYSSVSRRFCFGIQEPTKKLAEKKAKQRLGKDWFRYRFSIKPIRLRDESNFKKGLKWEETK